MNNTYYNKYREYIDNSLQWKELRDRIIIQRHSSCEKCGSKNNLNVHHGTYKNLYKEKDSDLFVLCEDCHLGFHKISKRTSIKKTKDFIDGIITKKKEIVYVVNDYNFEVFTKCRFCSRKLYPQKTVRRKTVHKSIVSPINYKCYKCRKVFFPKLIKP